MAWNWPGNVRELESFIERAIIFSPGDKLNAALAELTSFKDRITPVMPFQDSERHAIITALEAAKGKIGGKDGAAQRLGLKRTTLLTKMRKLKISVERSRAATVKA